MDSAYDHIQEESYPQDPPPKQSAGAPKPEAADISSEFQDAYKAFSSSPWASKLGGFWGTVKKQGEQYYENASKQLPAASANATAGLSTLTSHIRSLSVQPPASASPSPSVAGQAPVTEHPDRPESLPADIVKEAGSIVSRFRSEAARRLKEIEEVERAADESLLKFGANIRNFLRDAVTIAPPSSADDADSSKVLFESKDSEGKRVIHTTRFDAQLHVIHSSLDSFMKDPVSPQWEAFKADFDIEQKTAAVAKDLEAHEELRRAMEKLVPEKVEYKDFWRRYYFLRHVIETEEQRRREMLKSSAPDEEEVAWSEDSSDDEAESSTPIKATNLNASKETLKPTNDDLIKPTQPRRSNDEKSLADSDTSYDVVTGAPGTPQEKKKELTAEDSDEDDWE